MRVPLSLASNIFFFCLNHPQQPCLSPTVNVLGVCFNSAPLLSTKLCASCLLPHNTPKFHSVKQPFSYAHRLCRLAGFRQWLQAWLLLLVMSGTSAGKTSRLRATQRLGAGVSSSRLISHVWGVDAACCWFPSWDCQSEHPLHMSWASSQPGRLEPEAVGFLGPGPEKWHRFISTIFYWSSNLRAQIQD